MVEARNNLANSFNEDIFGLICSGEEAKMTLNDDCPCWFCEQNIEKGELCRMSSEFDCAMHETCLQKAINNPSSNGERQEGEIMAREFGIVPNKP